jgi:maleylacetate reductase
LGGMFDLPHAETHTVILPPAAAYNTPAAPEAMRRAAVALGADDAAARLFDLASRLGAPTALSSLGLKRDGLEEAALAAVKTPYPNPRPLEVPAIRQLLDNAFEGLRPASGADGEARHA